MVFYSNNFVHVDKIIKTNKATHIYEQDKLEQRVHEQWISAVQHVKSPLKIISLFFNQIGHRKEIIRIKPKQKSFEQHIQ